LESLSLIYRFGTVPAGAAVVAVAVAVAAAAALIEFE
jgi:hypothetical protein